MTSVMTSTQSDGVDAVAASRRGVDSHPNTDDQRLDAALVHSTSDAKVAVLAPLRAPRVGAQLCIHYQTTHTHKQTIALKHNLLAAVCNLRAAVMSSETRPVCSPTNRSPVSTSLGLLAAASILFS